MKYFILVLLAGFWVGFAPPAKEKITFSVNGVCGMCEERIEQAALKVKGVKFADWSVKSKLLTVIYNPKKVDEIAIHEAVAAVGHDTEKVKATDEVYNELHGCCKYRDEKVKEDHE